MLGVYAIMREPSLAAGACRFLLKDSGRAELVDAIRLAALGQCQSYAEAPLNRGVAR